MSNYANMFEWISNFIEIVGIIIILLLAFTLQLYFGELPCPLCLLQRIGFMGIAYGFLLNFRYGFRPSHYSVILLSGLFTILVALRQIALHILPGAGAYGDPIFGFHLYTWCFILATIIVIYTSIALGVDKQYRVSIFFNAPSRGRKIITQILFALVTIVVVINLISVILECGASACPDNPVQYQLLTPTNPAGAP